MKGRADAGVKAAKPQKRAAEEKKPEWERAFDRKKSSALVFAKQPASTAAQEAKQAAVNGEFASAFGKGGVPGMKVSKVVGIDQVRTARTASTCVCTRPRNYWRCCRTRCATFSSFSSSPRSSRSRPSRSACRRCCSSSRRTLRLLQLAADALDPKATLGALMDEHGDTSKDMLHLQLGLRTS